MKKPYIIIAILILVVGLLWIVSAQTRQAPAPSLSQPPLSNPLIATGQTSPSATPATSVQPTIGVTEITPSGIAFGSREPVVFTAAISDGSVIRNSVQLLKISA